MALKRTIPEEYMDYDYGFTGVSEEEYRKKETEADLKVSAAEKDAAQKLREASLKINKAEAAKDKLEACLLYTSPSPRDTDKSRMPSSA